MIIPSVEDLQANLRATLVVQSETLWHAVGSNERGSAIVEQLTGVSGVTVFPTDFFSDEQALAQIQLAPLAITQTVLGLREVLENRSIGVGKDSTGIDPDWLEQEHLDLLDLYLDSLPVIALGGWDWTTQKRGALANLLKLGKAWHRLTGTISDSLNGNFDDEVLTPPDLALLAGLEERSVRNLVGPCKLLRSDEHYVGRQSKTRGRSFVAVDRFDALGWLCSRPSFRIKTLRPGLIADHLEAIDAVDLRGRAALIGCFVLGATPTRFAEILGVDTNVVRMLGDGNGDAGLYQSVSEYVTQLDRGRSSNTVPA